MSCCEKVRAARSERRVDVVAMSGGGGSMHALESVADAWIGSGGARRWRSSGGGGGDTTLVGFGNCGCDFRDCGLREAVSIDFILADE
ncbi:hypothetical protein ACLB2K_026659 [Fragaria x ananassa]